MKSIANSVRIGLVRRRSISPNPTEDQSSTSGIQQPTNDQLIKKQHLARRISRSAPIRHPLRDQNHVPVIAKSRTARVHDINEEDEHTQHRSVPNSPSPPPSIISQKQTATNLNEIPTVGKWSTKKKILVGLSVALAVAIIIIISTVLGVLLTKSTESTTSTTVATTISPTIVSASWTFDITTADVNNVYNGQLVNSATYSPISSTIPYVGHGRALYLIPSSNQSFLVSTPFFDLSYTSFTIEAWIYISSLAVDRGIFSQCQCSTCSNQCLYLITRGTHLYIGFTLNDLSGSMVLSSFTWYHIAFVYNYQTQQQILYVSGVQDSIKSNAPPYQGKNGSIFIGSAQVFSNTNYFSGYIDNVQVTTRAKSSTEILRDASLMAYYSFDLSYTDMDYGPNGVNGTSINVATVTGRINQALRFLGSASYFQAYGFYHIPYGVSSSRSFSVSLWINPSTTTSSTIVQVFAASLSTYSCASLLGIYSYSGLIGQLFVLGSYSGPPAVTGPFVTQNTWTHVSLTYSSTNGYTLYVNGILFGATGNVPYTTSGTFAYLYIGYYASCYYGTMNIAYQGSVDEVYIHNRELTQADITTLANP